MLQPWKIMNGPYNYVEIWLSSISIGLGPIISIIIVDYYMVKNRTIHINSLYQKHSAYWYKNGFHGKAFLSFFIAFLFNIIGFLGKTYNIVWLKIFIEIYNISWFSGFFLSGILYYFLNKTSLLAKYSKHNFATVTQG